MRPIRILSALKEARSPGVDRTLMADPHEPVVPGSSVGVIPSGRGAASLCVALSNKEKSEQSSL